MTRRKKPCKECPFNKKANLKTDDLGGSAPEVYLGQLNSPFWLPCHLDKNYNGKQSNMDKVGVCVGAAMLRSTLKTRYKFTSEFTPVIEKDSSSFDNCADFLSHYKNIPLEQAEKLTDESHITDYVILELLKARVEGKFYNQ